MGTFLGVLGIMALAALLLGLWFWLDARRTVRRLDRMLSTAIDGGFGEESFDESAPSALESRMARFLNGSARSLRGVQRQRESIQRLLSDISHQTKTPLANLKLYSSLLMEEELTPRQREQAQVILQQSEKLSFLIETLVKLSRLETDVLAVTPKSQPLSPLLERAASQAKAAAEQKGIALQLHLQQQAEMKALYDLRWTAEALGNLLDNAVKYTPPDGCIQVSATQYELFCRIDVRDNGIGVAEEEQAQIFGRFYRGRQVREQEGLGIGLYLAREIAQKQGGYLKLSSRPGQGSTFSLYLPRG
mgnify:FL=1